MMFYRRFIRLSAGNLELAAGLLTDIGTSYWETSTFYPEDRPGENYISGESPCYYLFWFRGFFRPDG